MEKTKQKEFTIAKVIKKVLKYVSNERVMIIHLIMGLIKKILSYKNELLPTIQSH